MEADEQAVVDLTALEQAARIRSGELSSEEITRVYLARIERLNASMSAFVQVIGARALRAARIKDRERKSGASLPPFHGVPLCIKDVNMVRGMFTRFGSRAMKWVWSPFDDLTVSRLRLGGFVIVGKTATSELGAMPITEPDLHPPTRNPWNLEHSAGGSSGGTGAAVAAGLVPIGQGNDGAGSIRIPSAFCGLYGIKPSRGRVRNAYGFNDRSILYTCGPLARSVETRPAMLNVMAGVSVGHLHWAPKPASSFETAARAAPKALKIRFLVDIPLARTDPEVAAAVRSALATLEQLGHKLEEMPAPEGTVEEFLPVWQKLIAEVPVPGFSRTQPVTRWLGEAGRKLDGAVVRALFERLRERFLTWFGDADLVVTPSTPQPAPRVGFVRDLPPREAFFKAAELGAFTAPFNVTGQPAASVPLGLTSRGLPMGLQLAGRLYDEATVLQVSHQLEQARPWTLRAPLDRA